MEVNQILSLRDLALGHLPKLRDLREKNAKFGPFAAEQTLDSGWGRVWLSPLATAVERQAAQVLAQIYMHPETALVNHWQWGKGMDQEDIDNAGQTLALMREQQSQTEARLLDEARKLCMLSGAPLPPWLNPESSLETIREQQVCNEVSTGSRKWTEERLRLLLDKHNALKGSRHRSPTKTLAEENDVSETVIRRQLKKAKALIESTCPEPRPATFCDALWHD